MQRDLVCLWLALTVSIAAAKLGHDGHGRDRSLAVVDTALLRPGGAGAQSPAFPRGAPDALKAHGNIHAGTVRLMIKELAIMASDCQCHFSDTCSCEGSLTFMDCITRACNSGKCNCNGHHHFVDACQNMTETCPSVGLNCNQEKASCSTDGDRVFHVTGPAPKVKATDHPCKSGGAAKSNTGSPHVQSSARGRHGQGHGALFLLLLWPLYAACQ